MDCHDNHKVLYHETYSGSGEWQVWLLDHIAERYERYGVKGYLIPDDEILPFLKRHNIFFATLSSEQLKYIPDVSTNIIKLNNLISRQAVQFKESVREFNSDENLKTFNNTDKMDLLQRLREQADRAKEVTMYYEK